MDEPSADLVRKDFVRKAAQGAPLPVFSLESMPALSGRTCPSIGELAVFAENAGVGLILCVDRFFSYNELLESTVATTRIGLYSAEGTVLWRGQSTRGINVRLSDPTADLYERTRMAALNSNAASVAQLHRALAILN